MVRPSFHKIFIKNYILAMEEAKVKRFLDSKSSLFDIPL